MSLTKEENNLLLQDLHLLLRKLRELKITEFKQLRQPEFTPINFMGIKDSSHIDKKSNDNSMAGETKIGLELDETNNLWVKINGIFIQLESEFNSLALDGNGKEEQLAKQKLLLENALHRLIPMFQRAIELDLELTAFEENKREQYNIKRERAVDEYRNLAPKNI